MDAEHGTRRVVRGHGRVLESLRRRARPRDEADELALARHRDTEELARVLETVAELLGGRCLVGRVRCEDAGDESGPESSANLNDDDDDRWRARERASGDPMWLRGVTGYTYTQSPCR